MQITETASDGLKKEFKVVIAANDIAKATEQELSQLGKRVKIPGFRPGHIPMKVLKSRYGKSVEADVLRNVVNEATQKAIVDNNLRIARKPDVDVKDYKEEGDLIFDLSVETIPEMPEIDYASITVEKETFEVADSEIDDAIATMSERNPTQVELAKDKKAEKGNVLKVNFVGKVDGVAFEGGTAENFDIEIGSGRLIDTFEDQLIGAKAGDQVEVKVTFPDNYFNKELSGKPATFDVTVNSVCKLEPAKIDEEFAKARGFADLRSLREALRDQIVKDYDMIVRARMKKRLFDELENKCDFLLPQSMVETEFKTIWSQLEQAKNSGQEEDVFEGRKEEDVRKEYQKIAERRVRLGILLAELGAKQKMEVTKEEITRALMDQASQFPGQEQAVFDFYRRHPERLEELRGPILEDKAVDWILSQVKTKETGIETAKLREMLESGDPEGVSEGSAKKKSTSDKKSSSGEKKATAKKKTTAKRKSAS